MHLTQVPSFSVLSLGGSELAGLPKQRGAYPRSQERRPGQGVRRRARVEPDGSGGRRNAIHGARDQASHRIPGREVVICSEFFWEPRETVQ